MLPEKLSTLINSALVLLDKDADSFDAQTRYEIYKSFGNSRLYLDNKFLSDYKDLWDNYYTELLSEIENYTLADFALTWLALITFEKVLPIWDEYWCSKRIEELVGVVYLDTIVTPYRTLTLSKNILLGLIKVDEKVFNKVYDLSLGMEAQEKIPYKISCVYATIFQAFSLILYSGRNLPIHFIFDDIISYHRVDFASEAVKAYTCVSDDSTTYFDPAKRVEFWKWWLTEAIPQAWQLAQTSFYNKLNTNPSK